MHELIQLGKNTYYINGFSNIGIYRSGDTQVVLIDAGGDEETAQFAINKMHEFGWNVSMILYTHAHWDHVVGHEMICEEFICKGYSSDKELVQAKYPDINWNSLFGGPMPSRIRWRFDRAHNFENIENCTLPEGIRCIPCPGHSYNDLIFGTDDNIWFVGDALLDRQMLEKCRLGYEYDFATHLESLNILERLGDGLAVMGHGLPEPNIGVFSAYTRDVESGIVEEIVRLCNKGGVERSDIVKHILDGSSHKTHIGRYNSLQWTVTGILSYLIEQGVLAVQVIDNRVIYKRL